MGPARVLTYGALLLVAFGAATARSALAQDPEPAREPVEVRDSASVRESAADAEGPESATPADGSGWLRAIVGESVGRTRMIAGMWALHPFEPHFPEVDPTSGFGGVYGHWFGATFVNSYDIRAFVVGVERSWFVLDGSRFGLGGGYRVGAVTGYDERLFGLARHTPILPFGGVLLWSQVGPLGLDAYYVYRAITLEASVVF